MILDIYLALNSYCLWSWDYSAHALRYAILFWKKLLFLASFAVIKYAVFIWILGFQWLMQIHSPASHVLWFHAIWPKGWTVSLGRYWYCFSPKLVLEFKTQISGTRVFLTPFWFCEKSWNVSKYLIV